MAVFGYSIVNTAPLPSTSGDLITVTPGDGVLFPATPFLAWIYPTGEEPLPSNSEIVAVLGKTDDEFSPIVREQYGTSARDIVVGDQIRSIFLPHHYVISGSTAVYNPTDALTYYLGPFTGVPTTSEGLVRAGIPKFGYIKVITFHIFSTVAATTESSSLNLRINGATPTGGALATDIQHTAIVEKIYAGLRIPVVAGDKLQFQLIHPTWATNPTGVGYSWSILIEAL